MYSNGGKGDMVDWTKIPRKEIFPSILVT